MALMAEFCKEQLFARANQIKTKKRFRKAILCIATEARAKQWTIQETALEGRDAYDVEEEIERRAGVGEEGAKGK